MKLFQRLLVAPAAIGLLSPLASNATEVDLNEISNFSEVEDLEIVNAFDKQDKTSQLIAGGEGLVSDISSDSFSETTTASFSADFAIGAVDGDTTGEAVGAVYGFQIDLNTSFTGEDSLDISIDSFWNRSSADTLKFSLDLVSHDYPVSFYSYVDVLSNPRRYAPSGILLKSVQDNSVYYDENGVDFVQVTDMEANQNIQLNYEIAPNGFLPFIIDDYISLDEQLVQNGSHVILPYIFIIQEDVPKELYSLMGLQTIESISVDHLKLPIDIVSKTIFIQ